MSGFEPETQNASIEKASLILSTLASADVELGVMEISRRIGLNKSTVSRVVATLHHVGLVERSERGKRYRLGIRVFELGMLARERLPLVRHARPHVAALAEAVGFPAFVSVLCDATEVVLIAQGPRGAEPTPSTWRRAPGSTAAGALLLAWAGGRGVRCAGDEARGSDVAQSRAAEIRRQGYSIERFETGGIGESRFGVAAPVIDVRGEVVAALSVGGPSGRFDPGLVPHVTSAVCNAAAGISQRLGHRTMGAARIPSESLVRSASGL